MKSERISEEPVPRKVRYGYENHLQGMRQKVWQMRNCASHFRSPEEARNSRVESLELNLSICNSPILCKVKWIFRWTLLRHSGGCSKWPLPVWLVVTKIAFKNCSYILLLVTGVPGVFNGIDFACLLSLSPALMQVFVGILKKNFLCMLLKERVALSRRGCLLPSSGLSPWAKTGAFQSRDR